MSSPFVGPEILDVAGRERTGASSMRHIAPWEIPAHAMVGDILLIVRLESLSCSSAWTEHRMSAGGGSDGVRMYWRIVTNLLDPIPDALMYWIARPNPPSTKPEDV